MPCIGAIHARSNNRGTSIEPERPRKGRSRGRLGHLHQRCVGCETQGRPGGRDGQNLLKKRWGNRRRRRRRRGAAAAIERQRSGAKCARQCRATCRRAPQERLHECRERCGRHCAVVGAVADAHMRSMVQRRVTRQPRIDVWGRLRNRDRRAQRAGARASREARARMASSRHPCAHAKTGRAATARCRG